MNSASPPRDDLRAELASEAPGDDELEAWRKLMGSGFVVRRRKKIPHRWTDREIEMLRDLSGRDLTLREMARRLKKSVPTVRSMFATIGIDLRALQKQKEFWTDEKIAILKQHAAHRSATVSEIAFKLGRSESAILRQANKLNLRLGTPRRRWTYHDIVMLRQLWTIGMPVGEIAERLGRPSPETIYVMANKLGLRRLGVNEASAAPDFKTQPVESEAIGSRKTPEPFSPTNGANSMVAQIAEKSSTRRASSGAPPTGNPPTGNQTGLPATATKPLGETIPPGGAPASKSTAIKTAFAPIGGAVPEVAMLRVSDLHIDERYQRSITETGLAHVRRIAAGFHWHKFQPLIVTPRAGGGWSVMDGQHRLAAAKLRDIEVVPAQIVSPKAPLALAAQAELFVALNSDRLAVRPIHLYWANLSRGDKEATAVQAACTDAGVAVARFQGTQTHPAKTSATAAIARSLRAYGHDVVVTALTALRIAQASGTTPAKPGGPAGKLDGLLMGANAIRAVAEFVHDRQAAISVAKLARAILACGSMDELTDKGRAARRLKGGGTIWTPIAALISNAYDSAPGPAATAKQTKNAA